MDQEKYPTAWAFHTNTIRFSFNTLEPDYSQPDLPYFKEYLDRPLIPLPAATASPMSLGEAIAGRLSCRRFTGEALGFQELGTLLKNAYGVRGVVQLGHIEHHERPVPSGGGLYPLELYALVRRVQRLTAGVYHYSALSHGLEFVRDHPLSGEFLSELFMGQPYLAGAAVILVITAVFERNMHKYGDRGYRYVLFEAGHVAQNINLTAVSLAVGSFNLGGFFDKYLAELLILDPRQEAPLYGIAVGAPSAHDRFEQRFPENETAQSL